MGRAARPPQPGHAAWLRRQRHWLVVEPLPGYAPDLNPVEALWSSLKGIELANLAGDTLNDVITAAERGIQRIRDTTTWPTRSCVTAACPCGDRVTGRSEPLFRGPRLVTLPGVGG